MTAPVSEPHVPLVCILGAGRSGTNLLTFAFDAESPDFANLGENRYIWTKGQADRRSDRRSAEDVTPELRRYLHRHFAMRAHRLDGPAKVFLDKTPSNAFRIPFVAAAFENVRIIHIVRDGRDNLLSRSRQWKAQEPQEEAASVPMSRLSGKLRFLKSRAGELRRLMQSGALPPDRVPAILRDVLGRQVLPLLRGKPVMYGERVPGLDKILADDGVDAAASAQWQASVLQAHGDGMALGSERYLELRYESFLEEPVENWHRIMAFLGRTPSGAGDAWLRANIKRRNSGKWQSPEEATRIARVEAHLRPALETLGYDWDLGGANENEIGAK